MRFKRLNIETYEPGKSSLKRFHQVVKLSANESALGVSSKAKKILSNKNLSFFRYPDGKSNALRRQISKKFKCNEDRIICGAGSDEVIQMLCQLFLNPKDEVILPQYSFLMYRIYAKIVGAKVIFAKENNFKVSIPEIIKNVSKKTKIVFLANPNNPTGNKFDQDDILKIIKSFKGIVFIDEAYVDYSNESFLNKIYSYNNLIISQTFSKAIGLAGIRLGVGYSNEEIIYYLKKIKPPYNINSLTEKKAIESLTKQYVDIDQVNETINERKSLELKLKELDFISTVFPSNSNFLLIKVDDANKRYKQLIDHAIVVRNRANIKGCENCLRITVGTPEQNKTLINTLKKI